MTYLIHHIKNIILFTWEYITLDDSLSCVPSVSGVNFPACSVRTLIIIIIIIIFPVCSVRTFFK